MTRRVFFSFDYDRDIWRVGQIRNSGLTKPDIEAAGFIDSASWESVKRQTDEAIAWWINTQLDGTSVTVVLIGAETANSRWVKYEIDQSILRGNGLLGIYIHNVKSFLTGQTDYQGKNRLMRSSIPLPIPLLASTAYGHSIEFMIGYFRMVTITLVLGSKSQHKKSGNNKRRGLRRNKCLEQMLFFRLLSF